MKTHTAMMGLALMGMQYQDKYLGVSSADPNPIYIPKKHTVMSYSKQNRIAKKRRKK